MINLELINFKIFGNKGTNFMLKSQNKNDYKFQYLLNHIIYIFLLILIFLYILLKWIKKRSIMIFL